MGDPRRLLTDGNEFERDLLAAGVADVPQARSARRVAAALGVGATTLSASVAAAGATGTTAALPLGVVASAGAGLGVVKWVVIAVLSVVTASSVAFVATSPAQTSTAAPRSLAIAAPAGAEVTDHADPARDRHGLDGTSWVTEHAPADRRAGAVAPVVSPSARVAARGTAGAKFDRLPQEALPSPGGILGTGPVSSLTAETSALDAVHAAIRDREPERAVRALDAYDAAFPSGMLAQEAMVLRMEVASSVGDRAGVSRLADAFLLRHPESPLRPRVRAIVASMSNP